MQAAVLVLLNPHAGGGRAARLAGPLREACAARGVRFGCEPDVAAAHALLMAQPEGACVVLVGGDGTLHRMLPALLARTLTLGLVPCGSGNDTARALGLHRLRWQDALAHALTHALAHAPAQEPENAPRTIDIGEVVTDAGVTPFISSLAVGFDAAVAIRAHQAPRWLIGMPRYLWATLREVAALRNAAVRVVADGAVVHDGPALFASTLNTASYGSGMPAVPHAQLGDGRLELLLAGQFSRTATLAMLPRLLAGTHLTHARVHSRPFAELHVEADRPLPMAADGEALPSSQRFQVRVRPAALRIAAAAR
jgi:diacylglycerol kinase (ATP)